MTGLSAANQAGENVLISSASSKIPLVRAVSEAVRACGLAGKILTGDLDASVPAKFFSDGFIQLPRLSDAALDELLKVLIDGGVGYVLPTRDGELSFWAKNKDFFRDNRITVFVGSSESVENSLDKLVFSRLLRGKGLPAIETWIDADGVKSGSLVVKERFGAGSSGQAIDVSLGEAIAAAKHLENPIFQPFIAGHEYSIDVWRSNDGQICFASPRSRDLVRNGESVITSTIRDGALESLAIATAHALDVTGICVIQVIRDTSGFDHLLECNARFGGASTASIAAGLPLLELLLKDNLIPGGFSRPAGYAPKTLTQVRGSADYYF